MSGERSYAALPVPDLEEALAFYGALGFAPTFQQWRPYTYAVVAREDLQIHRFGVAGVDPAGSLGNVIVTVGDVDAWYESFRSGLRARFGRVPSQGIPRILRPRRKAGTATGFSVVDVGGNWLRFYRDGATEEDDGDRTGLARVIDVAARQGDSRGEEERAIAVLDAGLARHPDAEPELRMEALAYRAELQLRLGRTPEARADAEAAERLASGSTPGEEMRETLAHLRELLADS